MARTVGTESVADLVKRGALKEGEDLILRRRSKPTITGTITRDGSIRMGKTVYPTPSAAARTALGAQSADGWIRWRVPRLHNATLAEVRDSNG